MNGYLQKAAVVDIGIKIPKKIWPETAYGLLINSEKYSRNVGACRYVI